MLNRGIVDIYEMAEVLEDGEQRENAKKLLGLKEELNLICRAKVTAKYFSLSFYPEESPRALFKMDINAKTLRIKANFFFLSRHQEDFSRLSEKLRGMIKITPECTRCSLNCKQGVAFSLDGEDFFSCINEGHYFKDLTGTQCEELKNILKKEYETVKHLG